MPETQDYRQKALEEHGEECEDCGATAELEVHHRDRDRSNNDLENLAVLCHDCHMERHREERVKRASGPKGASEAGNRTAKDRALPILREGRVTPSYLASETGYSVAHMRNTLQALAEEGLVENVYGSLYELVEGPREVNDE